MSTPTRNCHGVTDATAERIAKAETGGIKSEGITLYDLGFIVTLSWHFLLIMQPSDFFAGYGTLLERVSLWLAIGLTFLAFPLLFRFGRNRIGFTGYENSSRFYVLVLFMGIIGLITFSRFALVDGPLGIALHVLMLVLQGVAVAFFVSLWMVDYLRGEKDSLAIRILVRFALAAFLALAIGFSQDISGVAARVLPFVSAFILVVSIAKTPAQTERDISLEECRGGGWLFFARQPLRLD